MSADQTALLVSALGLLCCVLLWARAMVNRRAASIEPQEQELDPFDLSAPYEPELEAPIKLSPLANLLRSDDAEELSEIRRLLQLAGKRRPEDVELFYVWRGAALLTSTALAVLWVYSGGQLLYASLLMIAAILLPKRVLAARGAQRQEEIRLSLPHTLDLIITCMEAGLNLEQAIERVTREIHVSDPELAEEFKVVLQELNAGLSLGAAFKKLSQRVSSEELRNLCNIVIQSITLGASLGRAMREYAASGRRKRELKLEEDAGRVTASLTLPLTLCLLPSAMLAMLAPAVVTILESLM